MNRAHARSCGSNYGIFCNRGGTRLARNTEFGHDSDTERCYECQGTETSASDRSGVVFPQFRLSGFAHDASRDGRSGSRNRREGGSVRRRSTPTSTRHAKFLGPWSCSKPSTRECPALPERHRRAQGLQCQNSDNSPLQHDLTSARAPVGPFFIFLPKLTGTTFRCVMATISEYGVLGTNRPLSALRSRLGEVTF